MKQGFVKVGAITPKIKVADPKFNGAIIIEKILSAQKENVKVMVFPELCLTGYTCGDLFAQTILLKGAKEALLEVANETKKVEAIIFIGLPLSFQGKLYNVAAVLYMGEILGFIPKKNIPTYAEFYEGRHFYEGNEKIQYVTIEEKRIPFGTNLLFVCKEMEDFVIGAEICEDLWVANPPSTNHALAGASLIVNLSASNETVGKNSYRELLVRATSARLLCGYVYASAGEGESTQDIVFGGHNLIAENGVLLAQSKGFSGEAVYSEIDIFRMISERRRMGTFGKIVEEEYVKISFSMRMEQVLLTRRFDQQPFVPSNLQEREKRCQEILHIQSFGLKKRYEHTGCQKAVIGISGGLDSTLALLVTVKTFDLLQIDRKNIYTITMPCFGTTDRTYENACTLARTLGTTLEEIDIKEAVKLHFKDIKHIDSVQNITYENSQARERTQVLMDIANRENGLVIGTGDMSELALGWATYNGDHMSMYGVNSGVPKTLVRHLVKYYADTCNNMELEKVLLDVLDTPVSPELLPPTEGKISQKTEDLVGPYELHDFYLYYMLRCAYPPKKIYNIALKTFHGIYKEEEIEKWLKVFYKRFFSQQFKRSCLPDGPKVGSVAVSPRGDLRMPSDASMALWMEELEQI